MFSPEMMNAASEMMAKMTPAQMAELQRQAANMTPDQMQAAMNMAQNATPDMVRQAQAQAATMTPEQIASQASTAMNSLSAAQKYKYDASVALKEQGNRLHGLHLYAEAGTKYSRAIANLEGLPGAEAGALRLACQNNLSNCHLQQGEWAACAELCGAVLCADGANRKALYRRGQALSAMGRHDEAVRDLTRALELSPESEREVVGAKLEEARQKQRQAMPGVVIEEVVESAAQEQQQSAGSSQQDEQQAAGQQQATAQPPPKQQQQQPQQQEGLVDDSSDDDMPPLIPADVSDPALAAAQPAPAAVPAAPAAAQPAPAAAAAAAPFGGPPPFADAAWAQQMMAASPDLMRSSAAMMANMSNEQIAAAMAQSGSAAAGMTPAMARMAASMVKNMPPEQLQAMAAQAAAMQGGDAGAARRPAAAAATAPSGNGSAGALLPEQASEVIGQMRQNPEMMRSMAQLMESMPAEQLAAMVASVPGAPAGLKVDAEQMKMVAQMMKNMSPEDLERMTQALPTQMGGAAAAAGAAAPAALAAGGEGGGGAVPAAGGMPAGPPGFDPSRMDMGQMRKMMEDPAMLKSMQGMLRSMDAETLAGLMASSGLKVTPEQAKEMVEKLGSASDTHVELLARLFRYYNRVVAAYQAARAWVASNAVLALGIIVLVLALLLRWLGWM